MFMRSGGSLQAEFLCLSLAGTLLTLAGHPDLGKTFFSSLAEGAAEAADITMCRGAVYGIWAYCDSL